MFLLSTLHFQFPFPLLIFSSTKSGCSENLKRNKINAEIFPHYLKLFSKYFIQKKKSKKILAKRSLKSRAFEDQVPDLLEENFVRSLSLAYFSSSKLFLEANLVLLEVSCTQVQGPTRSSKSISHLTLPNLNTLSSLCLTLR